MSEARQQRAVESIAGDMSLTEDMNDREAMRLLQWGASIAQQLAGQTEAMRDDEADSYLNQHLPELRRAIRQTNNLIADLPDAEEERITHRLQNIFDAASAVPVLRVEWPANLNEIAGTLRATPAEQVIEAVLARLLTAEPPEPGGGQFSDGEQVQPEDEQE